MQRSRTATAERSGVHLELKRLLNLASTLDCWVTIYPSLKGEDQVQFVIEVTDENDNSPARVKSDDLERGCVGAITILQDSIQRGAFD